MSDREQSEFNMAVSYLNRLNALFYVCDEAAMELNGHRWFHALLSLYRELSTEMKPEELTWFNEQMNEINNLVTLSEKKSLQTGQNTLTPELYEKLHEYEIKIRKILKKAGLQNKMMDDPGLALR